MTKVDGNTYNLTYIFRGEGKTQQKETNRSFNTMVHIHTTIPARMARI